MSRNNGTGTLFAASVFDLTTSDMTVSDPDNPGISIQTGESRSKGLELFHRVGDVSLDAAYTHLDTKNSSRTGRDGSDTQETPPHTLHDAAVSCSRDNWQQALNLQNLTDENYVTTCQPFACYIGEGRNIGGPLTSRFRPSLPTGPVICPGARPTRFPWRSTIFMAPPASNGLAGGRQFRKGAL